MERALQTHCTGCGAPVESAQRGGSRCPQCFNTYLRGVDAAFLDNLSRFGLRTPQVLAETCLRGLVLANTDDRKLLAMTVYEQFVASASALIGLFSAIRGRHHTPIARAYMEFKLDAPAASRFFNELATLGPTGMLAAVDLPHPMALPSVTGMGSKERKELVKALTAAVNGLEALSGYRDLGERALAIAADHLRGGTVLADRTGWLAGRSLTPAQVASIAIDSDHGRLDIATLRVDEERLEQVVGGIDVFTRLSRNLIHAFLTLTDPEEIAGDHNGSVRAARTG